MTYRIVAKIDGTVEQQARRFARFTSRRSLLGQLGALLVGSTSLPLLPVARASNEANPRDAAAPLPADPGDPTKCDYWRYCGINGSLCTCCGGEVNACPPGTEMSPITWIGTCENPADKRRYIISYNDCCGFKNTCNRCACMRNEADTPPYRPSTNNDINWCLGTSANVYHCSTAVLLGVALEDAPPAAPASPDSQVGRDKQVPSVNDFNPRDA